MDTPSSLKTFLATLRVEGIPVGPGELSWLRQVFRLTPSLDRQGLKQLLACTLVKNEQQREIFERLFDHWYLESDAFLKRHKPLPEAVSTALETEAAPPSSKPLPPEPPVEPPPPPPRPSKKHHYPPETRWFLAVIAVVVVIFSGWQLYDWLHPPTPTVIPQESSQPPLIPEGPQESSPPPLPATP